MSHQWAGFGTSHVGNKRQVNQDAIYIDNQQKLWAVADGMGGHAAGEKASQLVIEHFQQSVYPNTFIERFIDIKKRLEAINTALLDYAKHHLNGEKLGSTVVVFTECEGICALIWVGDSRGYQLCERQFSPLTWDHSHVGELVRAKLMSPKEAGQSKYQNILSRALGAHEHVFSDQIIFPHSKDAFLLLCSDGLYNTIAMQDVATAFIKGGNNEQSVRDVLDLSLASEANDNVSFISISSYGYNSNINNSQNFEPLNNKMAQLSTNYLTHKITSREYYEEINESLKANLQELFLLKKANTQLGLENTQEILRRSSKYCAKNISALNLFASLFLVIFLIVVFLAAP